MGIVQSMTWTFLSNHGNVIVYIDAHPDARLREMAEAIGITERAIHKLVSELVDEGYLTRRRVGRRNQYTVNCDKNLRHPALADHTLRQLLTGMTRHPGAAGREGPAAVSAAE
jgi:DNA-binding transcriptional regulator PaaX